MKLFVHSNGIPSSPVNGRRKFRKPLPPFPVAHTHARSKFRDWVKFDLMLDMIRAGENDPLTLAGRLGVNERTLKGWLTRAEKSGELEQARTR